MRTYRPEGYDSRKKVRYSMEDLKSALENGTILEGKAVKSDSKLNLYVELGRNITGVISYDDFEVRHGGATKSIAVLSKVGKIVAFKVVNITNKNGEHIVKLSRKSAQEQCKAEFIDKLTPGDIVDAKVTHIEKYGLFCDIGCGCIALLPIENMCVTRISNPKQTLKYVKRIKAVIKNIGDDGKITLTHKELIGTWEEEVSKFDIGDTVIGTVRSVEKYGVFVELSPNLTGLAEPITGVEPGNKVSVYVKGITPERMKVKLVIVNKDTQDKVNNRPYYDYRLIKGRIDSWNYSPKSSDRKIFTQFTNKQQESSKE